MKFKQFIETVRVGVVGFSDDALIESPEVVKAYLRQGIKDLDLDGKRLEIVSGTTNMGVPKICYEEAKKLGYKTIGITAEEGREYDLFPVDGAFWIGKKFGDETEFFLEYIDCLIKIGGGKQSIKEFKKCAKPKVEYDLSKGTYAGVRLSDDDADYIVSLCKQLELPNPIKRDQIHLTLLYSRKCLHDYTPQGNIKELGNHINCTYLIPLIKKGHWY